MNSLAISDYKLKENTSLQKGESVVVSGWKGRSVEILTKTALVSGSVLAGSVFATASAIYSKIISGVIMLGFAALAVARWVSSPLVNRVGVPENANQAVEAQSIPLDHQAGEIENISTPPVVDLAWYKDGKKVAGVAAGAMALAGIALLAYGQLADQEGMCPWDRKGLIPSAPFEPLLLSNSDIDDPFLQEKLAGSAAAKNFIKYLPSNHALFWNQFLGTSPALSIMHEEEPVAEDFLAEVGSFLEIEKGLVSQSRDDLENSSNRVNNNIINPQMLLQADSIPPAAKRYKLCQGDNSETSRLQGCKCGKNPDTVAMQGDQRRRKGIGSNHTDGRKT